MNLKARIHVICSSSHLMSSGVCSHEMTTPSSHSVVVHVYILYVLYLYGYRICINVYIWILVQNIRICIYVYMYTQVYNISSGICSHEMTTLSSHPVVVYVDCMSCMCIYKYKYIQQGPLCSTQSLGDSASNVCIN